MSQNRNILQKGEIYEKKTVYNHWIHIQKYFDQQLIYNLSN